MPILAFYCAPGNFSDKVIRAFSRSRFSHVELLAHMPFDGTALSVSASKRDGNCVREKVITFKPGSWEIAEVEAGGVTHGEALAFARSQIGAPYDTLGAGLSITGLSFPRAGRWFCSELVAHAMGLPEPHTLSPGDLAEAIGLLR